MQVIEETPFDEKDAEDRQQLALRIRIIMGALDLGPVDLARRTGRNRATWRKAASGESFPSRNTVQLFLRAVRERAEEAPGMSLADEPLTVDILMSRRGFCDWLSRVWPKREPKRAAA